MHPTVLSSNNTNIEQEGEVVDCLSAWLCSRDKLINFSYSHNSIWGDAPSYYNRHQSNDSMLETNFQIACILI